MSTQTISIDDRILSRRIADAGDEDAFRELYRRHTPAVHQLVLRILGSAAEAEDAVQETWIRAVGALGRFRWESSFRTWLTGIALNICRQELGKRKRTSMVELYEDMAVTRAPAPGERVDLERAIALLPDGYRAVLVLHDVEGYTHEEIGARLGIAAGTSKSQLSHARRTMRRLLGRSEGVER